MAVHDLKTGHAHVWGLCLLTLERVMVRERVSDCIPNHQLMNRSHLEVVRRRRRIPTEE